MITARKLCLQLWVQPRQRSLYVIRSQVEFPTFTCRRKKDHSSRRFLLILGIYRNKPESFEEANKMIDDYIYFYNHERIQLKT